MPEVAWADLLGKRLVHVVAFLAVRRPGPVPTRPLARTACVTSITHNVIGPYTIINILNLEIGIAYSWIAHTRSWLISHLAGN